MLFDKRAVKLAKQQYIDHSYNKLIQVDNPRYSGKGFYINMYGDMSISDALKARYVGVVLGGAYLQTCTVVFGDYLPDDADSYTMDLELPDDFL